MLNILFLCLINNIVMVEFVLVAVLHLSGDELGPEMVIDFYPTIQECIVQADDAQHIVNEIQSQWYGFMKEARSHGNMVPPIVSIGMFCKPLKEAHGDEA